MSKQLPPTRATAMVCFCDLPLPLIGTHMKNYGEYGIGLKKEWGIAKGLEPVIYSHPNGQTRGPISRLTEFANDYPDSIKHDLNVMAAYTKRYRGGAWRGERYRPEIQFYDEREWRYVALTAENEIIYLDYESYQDSGIRRVLDDDFATYALPVTCDAIQYLIVPDDSHILTLHELLKDLFDHDNAILVTTAIMTADAIREDM